MIQVFEYIAYGMAIFGALLILCAFVYGLLIWCNLNLPEE